MSNYPSRDERRLVLLSHRSQALQDVIEKWHAWHASQSDLQAERTQLKKLINATIAEHNDLFDHDVLPLAQEIERLYQAGHQENAQQLVRLKAEGLLQLNRLTEEQHAYRALLGRFHKGEKTAFLAYLSSLKHYRLLIEMTDELLTDHDAQELYQQEIRVLQAAMSE